MQQWTEQHKEEEMQRLYLRSIQPFVDLQIKLIMLFSLPGRVSVDENLNINTDFIIGWACESAKQMYERCETDKELILDRIMDVERTINLTKERDESI